MQTDILLGGFKQIGHLLLSRHTISFSTRTSRRMVSFKVVFFDLERCSVHPPHIFVMTSRMKHLDVTNSDLQFRQNGITWITDMYSFTDDYNLAVTNCDRKIVRQRVAGTRPCDIL